MAIKFICEAGPVRTAWYVFYFLVSKAFCLTKNYTDYLHQRQMDFSNRIPSSATSLLPEHVAIKFICKARPVQTVCYGSVDKPFGI